MIIQHGHLVFTNGKSVHVSEINSAEKAENLTAEILMEEPTNDNLTEILYRLYLVTRFYKGEIVLACNANHCYPHREAVYNYGFVFIDQLIKEITAEGTTQTLESNLPAFDLARYTSIDAEKFIMVAKCSIVKNSEAVWASDAIPSVTIHEKHTILFEHIGMTYRSDNPREAINAMLSVASGKNSKNLAWNLAYKAVDACAEYFPELSADLKASLGNGRYPELVSI